jgi:hypothetical protein
MPLRMQPNSNNNNSHSHNYSKALNHKHKLLNHSHLSMAPQEAHLSYRCSHHHLYCLRIHQN